MKTLRQATVYTTDKEYGHFVELVRNLHYVKRVKTDEESEESILDNIKAGLGEVRLFKQGKLKTTAAKNFLNEL